MDDIKQIYEIKMPMNSETIMNCFDLCQCIYKYNNIKKFELLQVTCEFA